VFLLLSLFAMHYILHYKMIAPAPARGHYTVTLPARRAVATPRNFGRMDRQKVGSLPPDLVFFFLRLFHS
jgi:hypothetical protein